MRNDNITIQQRNGSFLKFGLIFLALLLVGMFLISLRFLSFGPKEDPLRLILTVAGGVLAAAGLIGYVLFLIRGAKKKDALIITNKGFTNLLAGGKEGVYVEWITVKSLKVFGLRKSPMLGITLVNDDDYMQCLSGKDLREAQYNRSIGLPVITIAQKDVRTDIEELKNLFSRMIKGAISWENYSRQEQKKEPPRPNEFKTFAERRQEAEARAAASARRKAPDENQIALFPTSELLPEDAEHPDHTEQPAKDVPQDEESLLLYGDNDDESVPEHGSEPLIPEPESNPTPEEPVEDIRPYQSANYDEDAKPYRPVSGDDSKDVHPNQAINYDDEDDEPVELEEDEDPVPVEDIPAANPFASYDQTPGKDAITILNIDDE